MSAIRYRLGQVRCILSDWGVEAALADSPDILPEVFLALAKFRWGKKAEHVPRQTFLFPRCLMVPGILHICDNTLKGVLTMCVWGPSFLVSVKAISRFLRNDQLREDLRKRLSHVDVLETQLKRPPPKFADWRWNTLHDVTGYVLWLSPITLEWNRAWYASAKDQTTLNLVHDAFVSPLFFRKVPPIEFPTPTVQY